MLGLVSKAHLYAGAGCTRAAFHKAQIYSAAQRVLVVQSRWQHADTGARVPAAADEAALQRDAERLTAALHAAARGSQPH